MANIERDINYRRPSIFTDEQEKTLLANGDSVGSKLNQVPQALIRVDRQIWLISELYHWNPNIAYGLFMNDGKPTLGRINLEIFDQFKKNGALVVNVDTFQTTTTIDVFRKVAETFGLIVVDEEVMHEEFAKYRS